MNKTIIATLIAATALTGGCATYGNGVGYDDGGYGYYDRASYDRYGNYDHNRPDPSYNGYYADRYYRDDRRYLERRLKKNTGSIAAKTANIIAAVRMAPPA